MSELVNTIVVGIAFLSVIVICAVDWIREVIDR